MKKVMKISESDLNRIVKKVINENNLEYREDFGFEDADEYALELIFDADSEIFERLINFFEYIDLESIIEEKKAMFRKKYPEYNNFSDDYENISYLLNAKTNEDPEILADKLFDGGSGKLMGHIFYNE
jgi:hypothetical protein